VEGNVANNNRHEGISAGSGSVLQGNTDNGNGRDGIYADQGSTVIGNTAMKNARYGLNLGSMPIPGLSGYVHNVLTSNGQGNLTGGPPLGQNLCFTSTC
jgi:hypothetical protein